MRMPGWEAEETERKQLAAGVEIRDEVYQDLLRLGATYGVDLDQG